MATPHGDSCFVRANPAASAEAWMDAMSMPLPIFGRVPLSALYDSDRCLVLKILPDGMRKRATLFSALPSHHLFRGRYGRAGKGNGSAIEGAIGSRAIANAAPLAERDLPKAFHTLRRLMEARMSKLGRSGACPGSDACSRPLASTTCRISYSVAIEDALRRRAVGFDAVRHRSSCRPNRWRGMAHLCRIESLSPKLDLANYPSLSRAKVETTSAASDMALMSEAAE